MANAIWNLRAVTVDEKDGFQNVITEVHWTLTVQKSGASKSRSGAVLMPSPVTSQTYINLEDILAMPRRQRRATVLGFAEAIRPGFVNAQVASLTAEIDKELAAPVAGRIEIL